MSGIFKGLGDYIGGVHYTSKVHITLVHQETAGGCRESITRTRGPNSGTPCPNEHKRRSSEPELVQQPTLLPKYPQWAPMKVRQQPDRKPISMLLLQLKNSEPF